MADAHPKDPERVRTGRLGALTVHAAGKTNTRDARTAFMLKFEAAVDPTGELDPSERARRAGYALKLHMLRLNDARWRKSEPA